MSNGPIKAWRDSWKAASISNSNRAAVVHGVRMGRTYCGRKSQLLSTFWEAVTCADCQAARAADVAEPDVEGSERG